MFKRFFKPTTIIAVIVALILSVVPIIGTTAAPEYDPGNPPIPDFAKNIITGARLVRDNGKEIVFDGVLVEAIDKGNNSFQVTYEVGIPPEFLVDNENEQSVVPFNPFLFTAFADSDSHYGCDSTVSVCALVTLNYTLIGDHGWYVNTKTRWTRLDSAVTWSNARQGASCFAEWYTKSGLCELSQYKTWGIPTSGTTYTLTPTFAGSNNQIYIGARGTISGDQRITLKRGATTWVFTFCVSTNAPGCY